MKATSANDDLMRLTVRHCAGAIIFAAIVTAFCNMSALILPLYDMQLYDRVLNSRNMDTLTALTVGGLLGMVVYAILEYIRGSLYLLIADKFTRRLSVPTLQAAIAESLRGEPTAASQALRDVNELRSFITGNVVTIPLDLLWAPFFLAVLFALHIGYGLFAMAAAAMLFSISLLTDALTRRPLQEANHAASRAFNEIGQTVRNAEVLEAMGMLPAVARRWQRSQHRMLDITDRAMRRSKALAATARTLRLITVGGVVALGVVLVLHQEASPGSMMAANIIIARLLLPFDQLVNGWRQWVNALCAFRRIRVLLTEAAPRRDTVPLPCPEGRLVIDRVVYVPPGGDRPVLKGISFTVEPGDVLGIIGPSAAGKSTLARLIVGVWAPSAGGIYLDGNNTFLWEREDFGSHVGYVPQNVALLEGTLFENIARMAEADPRDVVAAAKQAQVHEMIGRMPFGYSTLVSETGYALSGGQRQRIALARALYGKPKLLVLDEPNSNLDHAGEQALLQSILEAKRGGATVIVIAHRPSLMTVADKLLVLKDGMIEQYGTREEVMKTVNAPPVRVVKEGNVARLVTS